MLNWHWCCQKFRFFCRLFSSPTTAAVVVAAYNSSGIAAGAKVYVFTFAVVAIVSVAVVDKAVDADNVDNNNYNIIYII